MNQFQVQLMKHLHKSKKQLERHPYDNSTTLSQGEERKRSYTQTSCNSSSTNPFTQIDSSTHYDTKAQALTEQDYIPELSRESSTKKRHTVEIDPSKLKQLITPSRVYQSSNLQTEHGDSNCQRSISTDFSSLKKQTGEKKLSESLTQLRERIFQQSAISNNYNIKTPNKEDQSDPVVQRLMRFNSFYNFPSLCDKEEGESRRRSQEYSQILQERHELWRNRSHSANQQKFVHSVIENGKKNYKRVKSLYISSQSRLRFHSDKEQFCKDVFVKVYDDCKRKCKDFDSIIKSQTSLSKSSSSLMQTQLSHPTFAPHVKQTDVQLKKQSSQRLVMNQRFQDLEDSMRHSKSDKIGFSPFTHQITQTNSYFKQGNANSESYQQNVDVSQFQGNSIINDQTYDSIGAQKISSSQKLQNSQNFNINSPQLLNSDYFDILNSYSTKSQMNNCQGSNGVKPLKYSAEKYVNQCNNLVRLEGDLKQYREMCQAQQSNQLQNKQQPLKTSAKKESKKQYLLGKCRHNLTTMYCSICNRQVKSKI